MRVVAKIARWPIDPLPRLSEEDKSALNTAVKSLLKRWKVLQKRFPEVKRSSRPSVHLDRYFLILTDLKKFLLRKSREDSMDLGEIQFDENCPDYFKRNYHYQTGGYFSKEAAPRYDHQIELLFLGLGHVMRKVAYSLLEPVLPKKAQVLEFGAASGTSGHQFKLLYPSTQLDLLEPGEAYLEYAQEVYPGVFHRVIPEFMERFKTSQKYDCIFSCFVMHEIPTEHWEKVLVSIKESLNLKGHVLIIDAQQDNDKKEHQFALDQFARDFFEPYFSGYRSTPLEDYFESHGFKLIRKEEVLFSKALLFTHKD